MVIAASHLVLATEDVPRLRAFLQEIFGLKPHFQNKEFCEFVLASRFRIALFKPTGPAAKHFSTAGNRGASGVGLTVKDIDAFYQNISPALAKHGAQVSGPPKSHPWGEKSFLLTDPDGNRWEITQSPAADGMLINRHG